MSFVVPCYNRGCGQTFDENTNYKEACTFHPGLPVFHDAYKGWSCCKRKCTDFTEFLNIQGCTKSYHSNVKVGDEPPKPETLKPCDFIEPVTSKPASVLERPSFDAPLVELQAQVCPAVGQRASNARCKGVGSEDQGQEIPSGTSCKNNGCNLTIEEGNSPCHYHPGYPVFHEGLKYWSCCQRRTTDFNVFLEQAGCIVGQHLWIKVQLNEKLVHCRHDWYQTSKFVVVSIFAKNYDPKRSKLLINRVRLKVHLYFPEEDGAFDLDMELKGIVNIPECTVNMLSNKVEVNLRKAETGSWPRLDIPASVEAAEDTTEEASIEKVIKDLALPELLEAVDLSDL